MRECSSSLQLSCADSRDFTFAFGHIVHMLRAESFRFSHIGRVLYPSRAPAIRDSGPRRAVSQV